jgi:uridylate kinase
VLDRNLKAADQSAIALAKEHGLTIKVLGAPDIARALDPEVGSTITPDD